MSKFIKKYLEKATNKTQFNNKEMISSHSTEHIREKVFLIYHLVFYSVLLDIIAVYSLIGKELKTFTSMPYEFSLYSLISFGLLFPFATENILSIFFKKQDFNLKKIYRLGSFFIFVVFIALSISLSLGKISFQKSLKEIITIFIIFTSILPALKSLAFSNSKDPKASKRILFILIYLLPVLSLRFAISLLSIQSIFFEQDLFNYFFKVTVVLLLMLMAAPKLQNSQIALELFANDEK